MTLDEFMSDTFHVINMGEDTFSVSVQDHRSYYWYCIGHFNSKELSKCIQEGHKSIEEKYEKISNLEKQIYELQNQLKKMKESYDTNN